MRRRSKLDRAGGWKSQSKGADRDDSQAHRPKVQTRAGASFEAKLLKLNCQEKPLWRTQTPVPETDTGGQAEQAKVSGITLVKELCKLTP